MAPNKNKNQQGHNSDSDSDPDLRPNGKRGAHRECTIAVFRREPPLPKGTGRKCKARNHLQFRRFYYCTSHRGCLDQSHFVNIHGEVTYQTCRKCRLRSINRRKKTPDEKAKAKANAKAKKTSSAAATAAKDKKSSNSSNNKPAVFSAAAAAAAASTDNTPTATPNKMRKKEKVRAPDYEEGLFVSSEEETEYETDTDVDMPDDVPGLVSRRTPDDDEDDGRPGFGGMGGGLTGQLIAV